MDHRPLNVLMWHVHGGYTNSLVRLPHRILLPTTSERGPFGRGRGTTWSWPSTAIEVDCDDLLEHQIDVAIIQRVDELHMLERWSGRKPGVDFPVVYLEHNTPGGSIPFTRHHMANRSDCVVVHVTHFNAAMWDTGTTPTHVIEHGIVEPEVRWSPEIPHAAIVVNDPIRRGRAVGTDLIPMLGNAAPIDVFGMRVRHLAEHLDMSAGQLTAYEDLPQAVMHERLALRSVYLHPNRWTSMSLSLIEAMMIGMPVVAFATTEVSRAVPAGAGCVSTDVRELGRAVRELISDPGLAAQAGRIAREAATARYGLQRFIDDWDSLLREVVHAQSATPPITLRDDVNVELKTTADMAR
jgi:glycosyltransferase involved in cell wall biosynthesis